MFQRSETVASVKQGVQNLFAIAGRITLIFMNCGRQ